MAFMRSVHDLYFPGGDALGHIHIARLMLGQPGGTYTLWRTPGMAIFLMLSGVTVLETWKGAHRSVHGHERRDSDCAGR